MNRFRKFSGESWKIGVDLISACKCRTTASPSITDGFVSSFMFAFGTMLAPSSSNQILLFRGFRRLCAYALQGFRRISFYQHHGKPTETTENDRKTTGRPRGPQITCAPQKRSLAPQINCVHFNKQPFRLGTGGTGVLGVGTGDRGLIHGDVLQ